jgi:hypothetical protein
MNEPLKSDKLKLMSNKNNLLRSFLIALLSIMGVAVSAVAVGYPLLNSEISTNVVLAISVLMGADAVCYFVATWGVAKKIKWLYPPTVVLLVVNILGAIFDDIGVVDIIFVMVNALILILLLNYQKKIRNFVNNGN